MGATQAADLADLGKNEMFPMETMLWNHLAYNIYPGQGKFIDVALAAIEAANMGDYDAVINIAEIMGDDKYNHAAPVHKIISGWRLEFFLNESGDYYD
jgi:hypothetical protein